MTEKKQTVSQKFVETLDKIKDQKNNLLRLAATVIQNSYTKEGLESKKLPETETVVKSMAQIGRRQAEAGRPISPDFMLIMIMDSYRQSDFGSPEQFKKDFKKEYPAEYAAKSKLETKYTKTLSPMMQKALNNKKVYN